MVITHCGSGIVKGNEGRINETLHQWADEYRVKVEIAYDGMDAKLERVCPNLASCRIAVEKPAGTPKERKSFSRAARHPLSPLALHKLKRLL
jgi:hypothetical protein